MQIRFNQINTFLTKRNDMRIILNIWVIFISSISCLAAENNFKNYENDSIFIAIRNVDYSEDYYSFDKYEDTIYFNNIKLKELMSIVYNISDTKIISKYINIDSLTYDIKIFKKFKTTDYKNFLTFAFDELFNIKINEELIKTKYLELQIIDESKLAGFEVANNTNSMQIKTSCLYTTFSQIKLSSVADKLSSQFSEIIEFNGDNDKFYSFEIRNSDFDKIQEELKNNIGLTLNKQKSKIRFLVISN